jgi:hypothetical protein
MRRRCGGRVTETQQPAPARRQRASWRLAWCGG